MKMKKKYKVDRALMQNTHGSPKSSFNNRKYKPGIHKSKTAFTSSYGFLLNQRQKLRAFFRNIKGKQMFKILKDSIKKKNYKEQIVKTLLSRIDSILFRSGIVVSFGMARQLINHGKVFINGIKANSCSHLVSIDNSKITFKKNSLSLIKDALRKSFKKPPSYISVNAAELSLAVNTKKYPKHEKDLHLATPVSLDNAIKSYRL